MDNQIILLKNRSIPKDNYEEKFVSNNFHTQFIPLLEHTHYDREATKRYLISKEFKSTPYFIVTSQRAVESIMDCLNDISDTEIKTNMFSKVAYTVGPATSKVLQENGFKDVRGGDDANNGAALAEVILNDMDKSCPIVFFTGKVRRDIIPQALQKAGVDLTELVVYKTEDRSDINENFDKALDLVRSQSLNKQPWIVFFSPQGTKYIVEKLKEVGKSNFKIASIGPTTETFLIEKDLPPTLVSKKPEPNSLFESIAQFNEHS
ncbi:Piso0_004355 [Millerozyma farinosa CBS 7064]|uniref:Piso0_004355 protein n=1 Tax=Pichia sorbitophila (strain ATCC MYA-4447 / BCRC 22081 / CBS 7064 / NBRC 10061 / NRRL Y-12695) TaxID=559304 RepID=G8Y8K4_PICSO|nr:Piso0_004355 [Millerozyma farinosa CBS 7064]CCE84799.1 Piso0_004355 [Millerozyma farinosa CBS 7064]